MTVERTGELPEISLSANAQAAIDAAKSRSLSLGHGYVDGEHLIWGFLTADNLPSGRVLGGFGLTGPKVRSGIEFIMGINHVYTGEYLLVGRARESLQRAQQDARSRGVTEITDLDLLGEVLSRDGIAVGVIEGLGVNVDSVRRSVGFMKLGPLSAREYLDQLEGKIRDWDFDAAISYASDHHIRLETIPDDLQVPIASILDYLKMVHRSRTATSV